MSHFKVLRTTVLIAVTSTVLFGAAYADDALKMDLSANKVISNLMVTLPIPHKMTLTDTIRCYKIRLGGDRR